MIKTFNKLQMEKNFLNLIKGFCKYSMANIILIGERWWHFSLKLGERLHIILSHLFKMSREVNLQSRLMFACGRKGEWLKMGTKNLYRVLTMFQNWIMVMVLQLCVFNENYWILQLIWVDFMVSNLHSTKLLEYLHVGCGVCMYMYMGTAIWIFEGWALLMAWWSN